MSQPVIESLDTNEEEEEFIFLKSKDGQDFKINKMYAMRSNLVKTTLEEDKKAVEVPLPSVDTNNLKIIIEYLNHHKDGPIKDIPKPLCSKDMFAVCEDKWDAKMIEDVAKVKKNLYSLILASNYMDIEPLLHLGCAKVASLIKGQPLDKIKEVLKA